MSKILVVDDEVKACGLLKRFLETRGLNVDTSNNGEDAIEKVKSEKPNVMLLDIRMPGMNGLEVLKKAKEISPETIVIIHTAQSDIETAIEAIRHGASDYVLKSCNLDELHWRVLRCIEKFELQRKIKLYEKILPVCCVCKKIRDDTNKAHGTGEWMAMEDGLRKEACLRLWATLKAWRP